jgi:hypothetical protein
LSNEKNKQPIIFSYDSLTIYNGGSSTSSMMGKYCGDSIPPSHVSSSNEVLIHFQSNWFATRAGFKMEYHPIGKTHQFKTTLNIMRIIIREMWEYYSPGPIVAFFFFLNVCTGFN